MMKRHALIILAVLISLSGCDFSKQAKEIVDNGVNDTKTAMETDISNASARLRQSYTQVLQRFGDTTVTHKAKRLYSAITGTSAYIDSLRAEMNALDNVDTRNVDWIADMFLNKGLGDTVFHRVRQSYSWAIDIALADTTKSRLMDVQQTYSEETKKQYFGLNSPLGVSMILYGVESEMIKDGAACLSGYLTE